MDSGGVSDPFVQIRYRGLEATSTTQMKTLDPTWQEVFHFRTPPGKELLDEEAGAGLMDDAEQHHPPRVMSRPQLCDVTAT